MAYEIFGANVVYEMSLTEALSGDKENEVVLKTPRYVRAISLLKEQIEDYTDRQIAQIIYELEENYMSQEQQNRRNGRILSKMKNAVGKQAGSNEQTRLELEVKEKQKENYIEN